MSLKTADDVYVKEEPCSDLPIEYEPASALAATTWHDVKVEWDSETCDESDVVPTPRLFTECDEDERAQSVVDLVKAEEQSESACLSEDEGQYIKEEVKEELELGPTVFLRPRVTLVCQESSQDNGTKKPDTESVSSGVLGHQKTRDEENPFKCGYCAYTTRYRINYTRHERQHIIGILPIHHTTEKTQAQKNDERAANTPCVNYKEQKLKCPGDPLKSTHLTSMPYPHKIIRTEDKPFKCNHCSYSCARKSSLKIHEAIHTEDKPFKCTHCSYSCARKTSLKFHESIHTGDKPYKCAYCTYSCAKKEHLKIHVRIHTGDKPYKCAYCTYSCVIKGNLNRHERTHTGEKPYKCTYCSYSCAIKYDLNLHERMHTEDKPFKCTYCSYRYARKNSLRIHERIHTEDKLFKCTHCSYSCVRRARLKIHEAIHTGDKPYKCAYCTYSCAIKGNLNRHERTHTGEKPYKCTVYLL